MIYNVLDVSRHIIKEDLLEEQEMIEASKAIIFCAGIFHVREKRSCTLLS